jgi:hypothetical protein
MSTGFGDAEPKADPILPHGRESDCRRLKGGRWKRKGNEKSCSGKLGFE